MGEIIRAENLTKVYSGKFKAVDGISVSVNEGEIFGFLGPNGSGKTTTFRMLTTLSKPTSGSAIIAGYDINKDARKIKQIIGYSCQQVGLDLKSTGRYNLQLFGRYYHVAGKELKKRVDELIELFELESHADRLVGTYSGGIRKKLEIATSLINRPRILFLDEPTLGLDIKVRVNLWDYTQELNKKDGVTIFLTTHYLEEAEKLCNNLAIIESGRIVKTGNVEELKNEIHGDVVSLTFFKNEKFAECIEHSRQILSGESFLMDIKATEKGLNLYVKEGASTLPKILKILDGCGITIETISLAKASLDDVFLKHTGNRISV